MPDQRCRSQEGRTEEMGKTRQAEEEREKATADEEEGEAEEAREQESRRTCSSEPARGIVPRITKELNL